MASDLKTALTVRVDCEERETGLGAGAAQASRLRHLVELVATYENGTSASQADVVWSGGGNVTDSGVEIDLRSPNSVLTGDAIAFAEVIGVMVRNKSTTAGETITVGAGSNPWITWLGATGDSVVVGPSGCLLLWSPVDGYATTANTGDILTLTASASDTIAYEVILVGRSA